MLSIKSLKDIFILYKDKIENDLYSSICPCFFPDDTYTKVRQKINKYMKLADGILDSKPFCFSRLY